MRGWRGIELGRYRRSARRSQSAASFFRNEGKWKKKRGKNYDHCGVEFPGRRHFIPLPTAAIFSRLFLFFISLSNQIKFQNLDLLFIVIVYLLDLL